MQRGIAWIVDDDSSIRWVLERALTGAGLSCTTFEIGNEVLDALTTKTPDVLLSDLVCRLLLEKKKRSNPE